ncbi:sulfurtransferase [Subtercola sp. Z020]|uniref:rhodanese-like domain-containing protein n=1 Tax=Subtercola sp. Z020 TaxID=2080582 RepID=UPI000CE7C416|nr:rhodanese-like domain-containing protein [Subtercola sp. Z020]PPF78316.1 sulfurtransferase [Subtercola sp. Z020]
MNEITVSELAAVTAPTIIDVREPDEFAGGHVPGAVNVPLGQLQGSELPEGPVYVICELGGRSARATQYLTGQGVDATNVEGGTAAWREAGLATTTE